MAKHGERRTLGRGLSALLGETEESVHGSAPGHAVAPTTLPIELVHANPHQPRRRFDAAELEELAASIESRGVLQPVIVRPHPDREGEYQIVAGERRWRAAQIARIHALPAIVRTLDDRAMLEIAIVENVQRRDLDPLEEAQGYEQLIQRFGYTQEALASIVGKSRSHLANTLRLLNLPSEVQTMLGDGALSAGHARALLAASDPVSLAARIARDGLTVRQTETLAREGAPPARRRPVTSAEASKDANDADTRRLEGDLGAAIGMKARIVRNSDGSGEVRIRYRDLDDFDRLCARLTG